MSKIYLKVGQSIKSESDVYYKILEFLGKGGNAYAYRCLCTSGELRGMEFVIKIQYNLSNEIRRERFLRESAFLKTCTHPAILTQYDYGTFTTAQEKFPFIVTNYMPETLAQKAPYSSLPFDLKVKFACQLLSAISFLQNQNIIHRDIKPSNIFINNNNAILGDFGLIKRLELQDDVSEDDDIALINETVMVHNETDDLCGYAAMAKYYRTPEVVNYANKEDRLYLESDIFQLGLVLTELFTGVNPLQPTDDLRSPIVLERISCVEAPNPSLGKIVHDTLANMLDLNRIYRISVTSAMDRFTGVYQTLHDV